MLENIKKFLKNKSLGYFILCGIAVFSLIFAIIFFATFSNPALDPINHENPMGNKAGSLVPDTIGIFLLGGFVVEVVLLLLPQYRFIQIAAIALFGLAFYKEVVLFPDFLVGKINNVEYNGGSFGLNLFYLIALFLIVVASIVVSFMGFYRDEKEAKKEMNLEKNNIQKIAKVGIGAVIVIAAVLTSTLVSNSVTKSKAVGKNVDESTSSEVVVPVEPFNPITPDIEALCDNYDYDYVPEELIIKEKEATDWDWTDSRLDGLTASANRSGDHKLVVCFEGTYTEGWQGDYSPTYGYLYLWDDGVYAGVTGKDNFKGFWYNSSLANGTDPETGNDIKDCLVMVSNSEHFESIVTEPSDGFYSYKVQAFLNMSKVWNQPDSGGSWRSIILNGYYYYPSVAVAIDATKTGLEFKVGDTFNRNSWVANRILKNKTFASIFKASEVTWVDEEGMYDANKKFTKAGEYEVKAKWGDLECSVTVTVTE